MLLHTCKESRQIALQHFKPFFLNQVVRTTTRPIYFRPKLDVLFIDLYDVEDIFDLVRYFPEVNEIEIIAMPLSLRRRCIWGPFTNPGDEDNNEDAGNHEQYCCVSMKNLLLVRHITTTRLSNRCCATITMLDDFAGRNKVLKWKRYVQRKRHLDSKVPDVRHIKAVTAEVVCHHCYVS